MREYGKYDCKEAYQIDSRASDAADWLVLFLYACKGCHVSDSQYSQQWMTAEKVQ